MDTAQGDSMLPRDPGPVEPATDPVSDAARNADLLNMDDPRIRSIAERFRSQTRYLVTEILGEGGMGLVLKAEDTELRRPVALKIVEGGSVEQRTRFMREAQAQARITHECICDVYEVGEVGELRFIAMRYIPGWTLDDAGPRLTIEQKISVIRRIADALHEAHRLGLIHRDIKPGNIMVEPVEGGEWRPYLLDFGILRESGGPSLTSTGVAVGTPQYMAPEQILGEVEKVDRRTDVYALGATFYELLAGRPPFSGKSRTDVLFKAVNEDPIPLRTVDRAMPQDLAHIVMKCLEKEPSRRYESARALSEDLQRFVSGEPVTARGASWTYRAIKTFRRNKLLATTAGLAVLIVGALLAIGARMSVQARNREILSRQLGSDVEAIEGTLRAAYMMPPHDIRRERRVIMRRIADIEARMEAGGRFALGIGSFAIGRAYRLLEDHEKARRYLQAALDSGYRDPAVSYELGLVLGHLYQDALGALRATTDPILRHDRLNEIERELRDPAIRFLDAGSKSGYGQGLIALCERRYDDAAKSARDAATENPWPYEEYRLEAQVLHARATDLQDSGKTDDSWQLYGEAGRFYAKALEIGPSHPGLCKDICRLWVDRLDATRSNETRAIFYKAVRALDTALAVDGDDADLYRLYTDACWVWGDHELARGADPVPHLESGIQKAQQAIRLQPNNASTYQMLGDVYEVWATHMSSQGRSPADLMEKSIQSYERAIAAAPGEETYMSLGGVLSDKLWQAFDGWMADPSETYRRAIESFQRAHEMNRDWYVPVYGMAKTHRLWGRYELLTGRDPSESLRLSLEAATKAVGHGQSYSPPYQKGTAYQILVEYAAARGADTREPYENARESYETALARNPDFLFANTEYARTHILYASTLVERRQEPTSAIAEAMKLLDRALVLNPKYDTAFFLMSDAHQTLAAFDMQRGLVQSASLKRAIEAAQKGLDINRIGAPGRITGASAWLLQARADLARKRPVDKALVEARSLLQPDCASPPMNALFWLKLGESHLIEGQALARAGRSPETAFKTAIAFLDKALGPNSNNAETHRLIAAVYLRSAEYKQGEGKLEESRALAQQGLSAAERALSIHPNYPDVLAIRESLQKLQQQTGANGVARSRSL